MKLRKTFTYIAIFIVAVAFVLGLSTTSHAAKKSGFVKESNGIHYYYKSGKQATGKCKINGKLYFFKKNGVMRTGLYKDPSTGKRYYLSTKTGAAYMNKWHKDEDGNRYYLGKNGAAYVGYKKIGDNYFYFSKNGKVKTGKFKINNKLYYAKSNGKIYRMVDGNKKMVALTFDDGPSAYTPLVLDTLEKYDAVATFYVVGNRVSTYSATVKRAYALGCEIGSHTYTHPNLTKISSKKIEEEMSKTAAAIKSVIGVEPTTMRPPGGNTNETVLKTVNLPVIIWSVDTQDWKTRNSATTISRVLKGAYDGAIILVHDLHQSTCIAAQTFIPKLVKAGYQLVTVSELAELRGVSMSSGTKYYSFKK